MRITTQMMNESAKRAGLPIGSISLLNYINKEEKSSNSLLEALNKNKATSVNTNEKRNYEELSKKSTQLTRAAEALLQEGEKSVFEQARQSGDNQKVYDTVEKLFEDYNSTRKSLKSASNVMNDFYKQMMDEVAAENKDALENIGIVFKQDGTASLDMDKMKSPDITALEEMFGAQSDFVNKIGFISARISDNANANIESLGSTYDISGSLYAAISSSKFDFWG